MHTIYIQKNNGKKYKLKNKRNIFIIKDDIPENKIIGYIKIKDLQKEKSCSDEFMKRKQDCNLFYYYDKNFLIEKKKNGRIKGYVPVKKRLITAKKNII